MHLVKQLVRHCQPHHTCIDVMQHVILEHDLIPSHVAFVVLLVPLQAISSVDRAQATMLAPALKGRLLNSASRPAFCRRQQVFSHGCIEALCDCQTLTKRLFAAFENPNIGDCTIAEAELCLSCATLLSRLPTAQAAAVPEALSLKHATKPPNTTMAYISITQTARLLAHLA